MHTAESDPPVRLPRAHALPGPGGQRLEGEGQERLATAGQGESTAAADVLPHPGQGGNHTHQGGDHRFQVTRIMWCGLTCCCFAVGKGSQPCLSILESTFYSHTSLNIESPESGLVI